MTENSKRLTAGALVAMLIGIVSLIGWMVGHAALADAVPGIADMTFNTALCLVLLSAALLLHKGRFRPVSLGIAGFVALFAMLVLSQLVFGVSFGIDNLFYDHFTAYPDNPYPGRMSPITIIAFIVSSLALLLASHGCEKRWSCLITSTLIGATGVASLYGIAMALIFSEKPASLSYPLSMSLFTALSFLAISVALWGLYRKQCQFQAAHDIFYPAIKLMFKLSFPRKFMLIALVFSVPLGFSMQYTLSSLSAGIEQAIKDRSGIVFLNESSALMVAVQKHRGILNAQLHGDDSLSETVRERDMAEIRQNIQSLKAWAHNSKDRRNELERLREIESLWQMIEEKESGGDADLLWDIHTRLIQKLARIMTQIGSELSYNLDAHLPFHHISNAALDHLPQVMETVGQIRGLGAGYLAANKIDKIGNYRLSNLNSQMARQMSKVKEHISRIDKTEHILGVVNKHVSELELAVSAFEKLTSKTFFIRKDFPANLEHYFLQGAQVIDVNLKHYFLQGTLVIDIAAKLQSIMLDEQSDVLAKEIERKFGNMYRIKSVALVSLMLIVFLFMAFYRSIMHMIGSLAETAERMKRGDMRELELMPEDELGHVVHSFNSIAGELTRVSANMQAIFNHAVDGIITIDVEGVITAINPSAGRIFGYTQQELVGKNITILMPERYRARHEAGVAAKASGGKSKIIGQAVEIEGLHKDGSIFPMDLSVNEMKISGKDHLFIGMVRDISSRKEREAENRRLATVVEQAVEAIVITDSEGVIQYINPAFEALNGYSKDEAIGQTPGVLKSGKEKEEFYTDLWQTIKAGGVWKAQLTNKRKDGTYYDAEHIISPIFDASGQITNFVGFQRNMTSEKALQRQMEHAQRLESLGVLAGGIAHDFNNILTAIMGNAALAERRLDPGSPARDFLARVEDSTQSAANLCKQMLAYSGKGKFEIKPINLSDLVEAISKLMEVSIKKNVQLKYELAPSLPAVEADESQLQQVILNLITNANEAIEGKSGVISLTTGIVHADSEYLLNTYTSTSLPEGRYVYLKVSDTGCGMDTKTIERIFDPFFTTKFAGRGLGMSAVVGIINSHRGALKIDSEVGRGTTFKILLPVSDREAFAKPDKSGQTEEWQRQGTVLIVDDEDTIREVVAMMLEEMGFKTLSARDGLEALEVYRQHQSEIVCVLLDMTMPKMGGEACFTELRKINPEVMVLLSSGYTEQDTMTRFVGKGLAGFIQKPYTPEALQIKLQQTLGK